MSIQGLLEDSLSDPPIGFTKHFQWYCTPIGIAALSRVPNALKSESLNNKLIAEGLELGLDLTKEETEFHSLSIGLVIIFYS